MATTDERRRARAQLVSDIGADDAVVVCVGRLSAQKGQDLLVEAWPAIRRASPGAVLVLVGSGPDEGALRAAAGEGVRFVGEQADVRPWLAAADVVAQPSRYEGMSLGVLEAMAAGRPVVASDAAGMREAIGGSDGGGAGGVVVPVGDVDALVAAIVARVTDVELANAEGRRARARVEARHGRREWLEAFSALSLRLAEARP